VIKLKFYKKIRNDCFDDEKMIVYKNILERVCKSADLNLLKKFKNVKNLYSNKSNTSHKCGRGKNEEMRHTIRNRLL
jgi:hypothetical protein